MVVLIINAFQEAYPYHHIHLCTCRVQKLRLESRFSQVESDTVKHRDVPYKFYVLGQISLSKQCRPRSDCLRSSLIRIYAVCHSISIFWMH